MIRLGKVLAVLKAEAIAGDSAAPIITVRRNPVIRLSNVAIAIVPVERTTSESEVCFSSLGGAGATTGEVGELFKLERSPSVRATAFLRTSGTGAGGVGTTNRARRPGCCELFESEELTVDHSCTSARLPAEHSENNYALR